jgi:hypothetical protein
MDWRASSDYEHCAALTREQWAWEFLRRNPAYRADYAAFIAIWRALEADYGAPPQRDFQRWKQDPRAYGPLPGAAPESLEGTSGELCVVDDERVLLECWMGAKWGFYKFPLDPARDTPPAADELSWRPPLPADPRPAGDPYRLDVTFDLSRPLPPQLEAAKQRLAGRVAELRRAGLAAPLAVAGQRGEWTRWLRVLDADAAGVAVAEWVTAGLCPDAADCERALADARAMMQGGYRDILALAP